MSVEQIFAIELPPTTFVLAMEARRFMAEFVPSEVMLDSATQRKRQGTYSRPSFLVKIYIASA